MESRPSKLNVALNHPWRRSVAWITLLPSCSAVLIAGQCWVAAAGERWPGPATLLAQAPSPNTAGVPADVQRWADAALAAHQRGDGAEALRLQQEVVKWVRSQPEPILPFRAEALTRLGIFLDQLGRFQEALAPTEDAVTIRRELAAADPTFRAGLARSLNSLSIINGLLGRRQEALAPLEEVVKIRRELTLSNPDLRSDLANSLTSLGIHYSKMGRSKEALTPSEESVQIFRELAITNPIVLIDLAGSLNNLGNRYGELGRRQAALSLAEEATKIYRQQANINPRLEIRLANSLNNLGLSFRELSRHKEALTATQEAITIRRKLAKSNPGILRDLAGSLNNLGIHYSDLDRHEEAVATTKEAVTLLRKLAKSDSDPGLRNDLASSLNSLGIHYSKLDRRQEALALSKEATKIYRELTLLHPTSRIGLARSLSNLGNRYSELSRRREALAPSEEAAVIFRELASSNPGFRSDLATSLSNLADLRIHAGDIRTTLLLLKEMVASEVLYLQGELPLLPEGRRQDLVNQFGNRWQHPFSQAQQGEAGAKLALFTRLNRQGLLQDIQSTQALLARNDLQRPLYEQLTAVRSQLASTTLNPEQQSQLLEQKEGLEVQLYRQLPKIRPQLVEPDQIARLLPAGAALVEFQRYWTYAPGSRSYGSQRYLALLLKADGTFRSYPLGEAGAIDGAVASALAASADGQRQEVANDRLAQVSQLVLGPLQGELAGVGELFVSPDGELNRLPFAILPAAGQDGRTLAEAIRLRILTTGRDLLRLQPSPKPGGPSVLITNPDFGASTDRSPLNSIEGQPLSVGWLGLPPWQPLGGTANEAHLLAQLLGQRDVISGREATASRALQQKAPRILHIATHGFFLEDDPSQDAKPAALLQDPLQRSGLVFAGANNPTADPADDGYLTAAEAITMDLEGTELVTLSACETGLGSVRSGEGVYGLQRALAVAGARSTLLSLWKVDDALTAAFMEQYYKRLKAGEGRADALRNTQADFRSNRNSTFNDVRVWGAFQLSGDWRPLPGL